MKAATVAINASLILFTIHLAHLEERVAWPAKWTARTQSHELVGWAGCGLLGIEQPWQTVFLPNMKTKGWSDRVKTGKSLNASAGAIF
jgi:hypothetical protein